MDIPKRLWVGVLAVCFDRILELDSSWFLRFTETNYSYFRTFLVVCGLVQMSQKMACTLHKITWYHATVKGKRSFGSLHMIWDRNQLPNTKDKRKTWSLSS